MQLLIQLVQTISVMPAEQQHRHVLGGHFPFTSGQISKGNVGLDEGQSGGHHIAEGEFHQISVGVLA